MEDPGLSPGGARGRLEGEGEWRPRLGLGLKGEGGCRKVGEGEGQRGWGARLSYMSTSS